MTITDRPGSGRVLRIGLTGGIASGKSTVAARLVALGARVIDHDVLAREVVEPGTAGLAAIAETFGTGVLTASGALDRTALGAVVFDDPAAREQLNGIVHPLVRSAAAECEAHARQAGAGVLVHDIPLLVESGQAGGFDEVVVVSAPAELRIRRLVEGRGMAQEHARARLAAQTSDDARAAAADVVLDGSGRVGDLHRQVDALWERWTGGDRS